MKLLSGLGEMYLRTRWIHFHTSTNKLNEHSEHQFKMKKEEFFFYIHI